MLPREDTCHAISVDVEDWMNATILQETGKIYPPGGAVVRNSEILLELFAATGTRATWFFLGEVAERFPALVAKVAAAGHELGVHGFHHHGVASFSPTEYGKSIRRAKSIIEDAGGQPTTGHRAVDFGIGKATWWALDEVLDAGFLYDASVFPAWTPRYGMAMAPLGPHWVTARSGRRIYEIPTSVCSIAGLRIPFAGGGWFRTMPLAVNQLLAQHASRRGPLVYYLHPCEVEKDPRLDFFPEGLAPDEIRLLRSSFRSASRGRTRGLEKYQTVLWAARFSPIIEVFRVREAVKDERGRYD